MNHLSARDGSSLGAFPDSLSFMSPSSVFPPRKSQIVTPSPPPPLLLFVFLFPPPRLQKYDAELFKMANSCLCAIAGALPPDFVDASLEGTLEKQASVDSQGNFDPRPINTAK